jgi:hypothetical protein
MGHAPEAVGSSGLSVLSFAPNLPAWYPVSTGGVRSVTTDRWQLIVDGRGHEELFDLGSDPGESHNLAEDVDLQPILRSLRQALPGSTAGIN